MSFAENLEQQIQVKKIGISELAKKVGVSRQTIHAWLSGKPPAMTKAEAVADALGCSVTELFYEEKDDLIVALESAISELPDSKKKELLRYAKYLKESD